MNARRRVSLVLLLIAIVAGTAAARPRAVTPLTLGGYQVLAADFHVHSSTWSDGTLTPAGLLFEARRQGLDVIAITGHNQVLDGKAGRWLAARFGGPTVLTGEELHAPDHHLIAVGIERYVDWSLPLEDQIDEIHRQGGLAFAAHPFRRFNPNFDDASVGKLDGSEMCHPAAYWRLTRGQDLERFAARAPDTLAAIGSSDFHGFGRVGICRTYVFARDASAPAIMEALRARRTVVYGVDGEAYGDPALASLAAAHPELREVAIYDQPVGWLDWVSRACGVVGLLGLIVTRTRDQP
jgi:hypothetical protein